MRWNLHSTFFWKGSQNRLGVMQKAVYQNPKHIFLNKSSVSTSHFPWDHEVE